MGGVENWENGHAVARVEVGHDYEHEHEYEYDYEYEYERELEDGQEC